MIKGFLPVIDMKPNKTIIDYWQTPYLRKINKELQGLFREVNLASEMHYMRK